ncbi:gas vesicle structural protein GvpA [Streptomyces purpurogeneiscleroticus]|uniref:gas vesicle structural protein GvpA n=1 Tax=Streptomyces purpurogeneiscleroticus TaxID=68259 RepID=UPI001CBF9BDD|nr:gas vesicle structural protein GvpA [Streptomyces purpurogeneiscleroticus]MBZ4014959.1 gas vesicle protein [Streptomyces purpurogeneiscleroticus]
MTTTTYSDDVMCRPRAGTLYDVLELILDRGMVIDVFLRVSLVGIEILKVDARIVVASVDTYLRFAEACNRLDLERDSGSTTIPELLGGDVAKSVGKRKVKRAAESVGDTVRKAVGGGDDDKDTEEKAEEQEQPRRRAPARSSATKRRRAEA